MTRPGVWGKRRGVPGQSVRATVFEGAWPMEDAAPRPTRALPLLVAMGTWLVWNSGSLPSLSSTSPMAWRWLV